MSIPVLLVNTTVISNFLPVLAALYNYRRLDRVLKLMAVFCLISILPDQAGLVTGYLNWKYNTIFLMHLFDLVAVVFFTFIYYYAFYQPALKKITLILGSVTLLIMISSEIFIESIWVYPSICNTILCLLLIPLSLIYFYQILSRQEFTHIEKQGMFWINAGVLIYFSINVFLFMLYNKITSVEQQDYYMLQNATNIIANLLYSVGLLCRPQKKKITLSRY